MRVTVVHSFHHDAVPSGENVVVQAQLEAFRHAGHEVTLVAQYNDERHRRRTYPLEAAATVLTGVGPDPTEQLRASRPDVVHVHNLFPNFGSRWLARWEGPLVATLHNFRPMCPAGTLLRDGRACHLCLDRPSSAVRHACFQDSRVATLPLAVATRGGAPAHPVVRRADRLIAISERARAEYRGAGVAPGRIAVVPNAVTDVADLTDVAHVSAARRAAGSPRDRWLFVGRLSSEKGIRPLLESWPEGVGLDVVGSGGLDEELRARWASEQVRFLGHVPNADVRRLVGGYVGLVVPSLWAEAGPPLTYVEALAAGVPTVAVEGNGAADDIAVHGTGRVIPRSLDPYLLATALKEVEAEPVALPMRCRQAYEQRFAPAAWVDALTRVYEDAGVVRTERV